jgi:hypothetical protein
MQISPVQGSPIYQQPEYLEGNIHLFQQFKFCELSENMRQQGDQRFISLLNSLREGRMTEQQCNILEGIRQRSTQQGEFEAGQAIRIVPTLALANQHNQEVISEVNIVKFSVISKNRVPAGVVLTRTLQELMPLEENKTCGLPNQLTIFVGYENYASQKCQD